MEKHPSRQELLNAVATAATEITDHLRTCEDCRILFELFQKFSVAGELPLPHAPVGWIMKAEAIVEQANPLRALGGIIARLSFDSWQAPAAVGVRSQHTSSDRRLQFEAGPLVVDLRAEHQPTGWEFTAQITGMPEDTHLHLIADKLRVAPDASGFYQWSSPRPPKSLSLRAGETQVTLPEISWKDLPRK